MSLVDNIIIRVNFDDITYLDISAASEGKLLSFEFSYELDDDISKLIANISANEVRFSISNNDKILSPDNVSSPYYGLIKEGMKIEIFNNSISFGTYYVTTWASNNSLYNNSVKVVATDRLQRVLNSPVNLLVMDNSIALDSYITKIFESVGIASTDLDIDSSFTDIIDFSIIKGSNLSSILNDLCVAFDMYIYVNLLNYIVITTKDIVGAADYTLSTADRITSINNGLSLAHSANSLKVTYNNLSISNIQALLTMADYGVPNGVSQLADNKMSSNVFSIDSVVCNSSGGVEITDFDATQGKINFTLSNSSGGVSLTDIIVYGKTINSSESYLIEQDIVNIADRGRKEINVNSFMLQDSARAESLLDILWARLNTQLPYIKLNESIVEFKYNLRDICQVNSTVLGLSFLGYVHSVTYTWVAGDSVKAQLGLKYTTAL